MRRRTVWPQFNHKPIILCCLDLLNPLMWKESNRFGRKLFQSCGFRCQHTCYTWNNLSFFECYIEKDSIGLNPLVLLMIKKGRDFFRSSSFQHNSVSLSFWFEENEGLFLDILMLRFSTPAQRSPISVLWVPIKERKKEREQETRKGECVGRNPFYAVVPATPYLLTHTK